MRLAFRGLNVFRHRRMRFDRSGAAKRRPRLPADDTLDFRNRSVSDQERIVDDQADRLKSGALRITIDAARIRRKP
jgi:hypothetical protein